MSRAFVTEPDTDESGTDLPDRLISPEPNYVTPEGLAMIEAELKRVHAQQASAHGDSPDLPHIARDLRYWQARRASAQVIGPIAKPDHVQFGTTVVIRRNGRKQSFKIVGEDEADPAAGTLSFVAPLARALIGKEVGETVKIGDDEAKIVAIC
jgi:transcription elongation GreA/GreB family factor